MPAPEHRFVQIAVTTVLDTATLYALDSEGVVWKHVPLGWVRLDGPEADLRPQRISSDGR